MASLLPLLAAVPVLASALAALVPWIGVRRALVHTVPLATAAFGVVLLVAHRTEPVLATHVGGFVPGIAIPFVSDSFSALMLVATGLVAAISLWLCDLTGELRRRPFFSSLALLLLAGVNGALLTGDLFNLFVFIEVMLLPSYALLAMTGGWRRLGVGRLFVIINLLTSTVLLAGVGLVYAVQGTVNLAALAGTGAQDGRTAAATGLVLVALCIKAGAVPVHGWLPRAYPATSSGVMALFAGLHTKVALYAVIRIWATVFDLNIAWSWLLGVVAAITVLWGALASAYPSLVREVLAWQMVSGVGVILAALAVGSAAGGSGAGVTGSIAYMLHHMVTMGALIAVCGAIEYHYGSGRLSRIPHLWRTDRPTGILLAFGIAALLGLPFTSGLVGKFEVISGALTTGGFTGVGITIVVLVGSLLGLVAMIRLWRGLMWAKPNTAKQPTSGKQAQCDKQADGPTQSDTRPARARGPIPATLLIPAGAFAALSLAFFLGYGTVAPALDRAVNGLVDTSAYRQAVLGEATANVLANLDGEGR